MAETLFRLISRLLRRTAIELLGPGRCVCCALQQHSGEELERTRAGGAHVERLAQQRRSLARCAARQCRICISSEQLQRAISDIMLNIACFHGPGRRRGP